uniref:Uncharacterized protein n=1 Tax=Anguilla anguilla TaxID=7936 RepID=A0A0E9S2F1_ANGAN
MKKRCSVIHRTVTTLVSVIYRFRASGPFCI